MSEMFVEDNGDFFRVGERLEEAGAAAVVGMDEVMNLILLDMMRANAENIASGGRRFGGSYANLRPDTVKKKGGAEILYTMGARPNYTKLGDDTLVRSVTEPGAEYQHAYTDNEHVELGTDRPYAATHQYGHPGRHIPRRPFLVAAPQDQARWKGWIAEKLMAALTEE